MSTTNGDDTVEVNSVPTPQEHSESYPKLLENGLSVAVANSLDVVLKEGIFLCSIFLIMFSFSSIIFKLTCSH